MSAPDQVTPEIRTALEKLRREIEQEEAEARREEAATRKAFLAERIAEMPEEERPDARGIADLDRRLLAATYANDDKEAEVRAIDARAGKDPLIDRELAALWRVIEERFREDHGTWPTPGAVNDGSWGGPGRPGMTAEEVADAGDRLVAAAIGRIPRNLSAAEMAFGLAPTGLRYRVFLAYFWPGVWREWLGDATATKRAGPYSLPCFVVASVHHVLGGKRHGAQYGGKVAADFGGAKLVSLSVETPSGTQIEIGAQGLSRLKASDFDADGNLRPTALVRIIQSALGPEVAIMGHVAAFFAEADSRAEGRPWDGRLWVWPSRIAERLGYRKVGNTRNGKARSPRFPTAVLEAIRAKWETYANATVTATVKLPGGPDVEIRSTLLAKTGTSVTFPNQRKKKGGPDPREEWCWSPQLAPLFRKNFLRFPADLLDPGAERPDVWARRVRVYEVLELHGRVNAKNLPSPDGRFTLTKREIIEQANVTSPAVRDGRAERELDADLRALHRRGFLPGLRFVTAKSGLPAVSYRLRDERMAELAEVGAKARAFLPATEANAQKSARRPRANAQKSAAERTKVCRRTHKSLPGATGNRL